MNINKQLKEKTKNEVDGIIIQGLLKGELTGKESVGDMFDYIYSSLSL